MKGGRWGCHRDNWCLEEGCFKGTRSQSSACLFIKMLCFCQHMLYHPYKQYDHVIMLSKNQSSTRSPGSHLHLINLGGTHLTFNGGGGGGWKIWKKKYPAASQAKKKSSCIAFSELFSQLHFH